MDSSASTSNGFNIMNLDKTGENTYDTMFPALPPSAGLVNSIGNQHIINAATSQMRVNIKEVTQAFCIPAERMKQDNSDVFGEGEYVRICSQIMKELSCHIEISTSKDKSFTFLITGLPNKVIEAKRRVINSCQALVTSSIEIPKDHLGSVLGKNGNKLKQLQQTTGTKIAVSSDENDIATINVTGTRDDIEKALHEIITISDERSKKEFVRMSIPKSYHPFINGPNGDNMTKLMTDTNTRINVPPFHVDTEVITILGEKKNVNDAKTAITVAYENAQKLHEMSFDLEKYKHKYIAGPRRAHIFEIMKTKGVSVEIPPADNNSLKILLRGPEKKVTEAYEMVMKYADGVTVETLPVKKRYHGFVIGKKGSTIRELQECHEKIHVEFCGDEVKVEGPIQSVNLVKDKIISIVQFYNDNYNFAELPVDPKYLKYIIGKNGYNVNKLKSTFDVTITICEDPGNVILVGGSKNNVNNATAKLRDIIAKLENQIKYEMKINPNLHSAIIGPKGDRVKEIQERFDVVVQLPTHGQTENVDIVTIRGLEKDVESCREYLEKLVNELSDAYNTQQLLVYRQFLKLLVDDGGLSIQQIMAETNTDITLPSAESERDLITISGKKQNVDEAKTKIFKMQNEMENLILKEVTVAAKFHDTLKTSGTIKQIRTSCGGVQFKIPPIESNSDKILIRGPQDDVLKAKQQLLNALLQLDSSIFTDTVKTNPDHYKFLIGRKGCNVKKIIDTYDVRVVFPDGNNDDILIAGKKKNVEKGKLELMQMIDNLNNQVQEEIEFDPVYRKYLLASKKLLIQKIINDSGGSNKVNIICPKNEHRVLIKGLKENIQIAKDLFQKELKNLSTKIKSTAYIRLDKDDKKMIGFVVQNLAVIEKRHNIRASIQTFSTDDGRDTEDRLVIVGRVDDCENAKQDFLRIIPFTKEIVIPRVYHRILIGRYGSVINELTEGTNVSVFIPSIKEESDIIKLRGPYQAVQEVTARFEARFEQIKVEQYALTIHVEPSARPFIIGRDGERVNSLRQKYNVIINLPDKSDVKTKEVLLYGRKENVEAVAHEITNIIEEKKTQYVEELHLDGRVRHKMIGQQGRFIQNFMKEYNVVINYARFENSGSNQTNTICLMGEMSKVKECVRHMLYLQGEFLREIEEQKQNEGNTLHTQYATNGKGFIVKNAPCSFEGPSTSFEQEFPAVEDPRKYQTPFTDIHCETGKFFVGRDKSHSVKSSNAIKKNLSINKTTTTTNDGQLFAEQYVKSFTDKNGNFSGQTNGKK